MMHDGYGQGLWMHPLGLLLAALLLAVPFWRICAKAGYTGWMGLLVLVPIVNLLLVWFLALAPWPLERRAGARPPEPSPDRP